MYRETLNLSLRQHIYTRDKGRCVYCSVRLESYHIDHVFPHSEGGPDYAGNLVLACPPCNLQKGERMDIAWISKGLLHLVIVGEDLGWIARHHLSSWTAFATPLFVDLPEAPPVQSNIDEDEDAQEIKLLPLDFKRIRLATGYQERTPIEKLQEARKRVDELVKKARRRRA